MERLWPALQQIDGSSGALGNAVRRTLEALIPVSIAAPADSQTRSKWMDRLYEAVCEDGVEYLMPVEEQWGAICGSRELATQWADRMLPLVREVWGGRRSDSWVVGATLCLSCLLETERFEELQELLLLPTHRFWHFDKFGAEALDLVGIAEIVQHGEPVAGWEATRQAFRASRRRRALDALLGGMILFLIAFAGMAAVSEKPQFMILAFIDLVFGILAGHALNLRRGGLVEGAAMLSLGYLFARLVRLFAAVPLLPEGTAPIREIAQVVALSVELFAAALLGAALGWRIRRASGRLGRPSVTGGGEAENPAGPAAPVLVTPGGQMPGERMVLIRDPEGPAEVSRRPTPSPGPGIPD